MAFNPKTTAFLFPGQGSQEIGMGKELAAKFDAAADTFAEADEIVGFALSELCWEGPTEDLNDTINTQPAILVHSIAALRTLRAERPEASCAAVAGHSLGEFSALVCAGSVDFADAVRLVRVRGKAMKQAGAQSPGSMAAVLGLDAESVGAICSRVQAETGEVIQLANDNCPGQYVVSGSESGMLAVTEALKAAGARRIVPLAVSIAAHSTLMEPAQAELYEAIEATTIRNPDIPVYANVSAGPVFSEADIRSELRAQLTSQIRWTESIQAMGSQGITSFLELGPKDVLAELCRRIDKSVSASAFGDPAGLRSVLT